MQGNVFPSLRYSINHSIHQLLTHGEVRVSGKWQGIEKELRMLEYDELFFRALMPQSEFQLQKETRATQPWAENHFCERVLGKPYNPGETYKEWPYYGNKKNSDASFRNVEQQFSHTYMERYWPKFAGEPWAYAEAGDCSYKEKYGHRKGIRYPYGDLLDVVNLLASQPDTRQAYLPVWFPEDTGVLHGGRVPCTIGYHFILRDNRLNVNYHIRSCDALRHFRNDIYLTVRLAQWVLACLYQKDLKNWSEINLGILTMNITNFHVFEQEKNLIS